MKTILALDMGGTSIKAGLYSDSPVKYDPVENNLVKKTSWNHNYQNCGLEKAQESLLKEIKTFWNGPIDAIGLSIAGLIGIDDSLYRSTVLTSFQSFNLKKFLQEKLGVETATIDNDADCGAWGEWNNLKQSHLKQSFFYVVVGSGIGSAFVDENGNLPYKIRLDLQHQHSDHHTDHHSDHHNSTPNDLGLQVAVPKSYLYQKMAAYGVSKSAVDFVLVDEAGKPFCGPSGDIDSVRLSQICSAVQLRIIMEMLEPGFEKNYLRQCYGSLPRSRGFDFKCQFRKDIGKILALSAERGNDFALSTFNVFGHFLGYGIAEAQRVILAEQNLSASPEVILAGPVMASYNYFINDLQQTLIEKKVDCQLRLSSNYLDANLKGAYLRAVQSLEQKCP